MKEKFGGVHSLLFTSINEIKSRLLFVRWLALIRTKSTRNEIRQVFFGNISS